ncbi:MAG: rmuC [Ignavibacteria bacterium]|nr:rmuC [Ignavibacteria bacterium]
MTTQRSLEIKVGFVAIASLIIFILGITWGRGYSLSVALKEVKFRFPKTTGLQPSSPIVVNGVKRGSVISVKNDQGGVLVLAALDDISDLRKDVSARLTILEITGGKKIEISPGTIDGKFNPQNEIPGTCPADLAELIVIFGDVAVDGKNLIRRLDTITAATTQVLRGGDAAESIKKIISEAEKAFSSLNSMLSENRSAINTTAANIKQLSTELRTSIENNSPKITSLLSDFETTLIDLKTIIRKADTAAERANSMLGTAGKIADSIRTGQGFASKILFDLNFSTRIESSLSAIDSLVAQIKQYGINTNIRLGTRP